MRCALRVHLIEKIRKFKKLFLKHFKLAAHETMRFPARLYEFGYVGLDFTTSERKTTSEPNDFTYKIGFDKPGMSPTMLQGQHVYSPNRIYTLFAAQRWNIEMFHFG